MVRGPGSRRAATGALRSLGARDRRSGPGIENLALYSVDDRSLQLHWSAATAGSLRLVAGPVDVEVDSDGGPGTAVLDGLPADTEVDVRAETACGRVDLGPVRTLPRPGGALLGRLATITDIHFGEARFGPERYEDPWPPPPGGVYPWRCATAAIDEAVGWGAAHLVVKGDLTNDAQPAEFEAVGRLLTGAGIPSDVVQGNHDVRRGADGSEVLSRAGIDSRPTTRVRDLQGLRLVLAHTPTARDHWGEIPSAEMDRIEEAASGAPGPCMLVAHHSPMTGALMSHYPPGLRAAPSRSLLRRLATVNPATVVVAGHTHRNRLRWSQGLLCVETGSTKDYPGGWTGYSVYEGGIVQTARRTASVAGWTERTGGALLGQWGRWSTGVLADRSWTLEWPAR